MNEDKKYFLDMFYDLEDGEVIKIFYDKFEFVLKDYYILLKYVYYYI